MEPTPVRFFVSPTWRRNEIRHIPLLYPLWGGPVTPKLPFYQELFKRQGFDTNYYTIVDDVDSADAILAPYPYAHMVLYAPDILVECERLGAQHHKLVVFDDIGDNASSIKNKDAIIIRYGGYRFLPDTREIIIPPYADDLLELYQGGILSPRHKHEKPIIGFAGWATLTLGQRVKAVLKELSERLRGVVDSRYRACTKGVFFRMQAVLTLEKSSRVETNFIKRQSYSGHTGTAAKSPADLRREMVDNLLASDYGLDVRGDANASTRLFEMLSLGVVPVIVDTERNFPLSALVDYSRFSLIVDFRKLPELPNIIADFHARLSDEEFMSMQQKARDAYRNYFRVDALTPHLVREIQKRVQAFSSRQTQK